MTHGEEVIELGIAGPPDVCSPYLPTVAAFESPFNYAVYSSQWCRGVFTMEWNIVGECTWYQAGTCDVHIGPWLCRDVKLYEIGIWDEEGKGESTRIGLRASDKNFLPTRDQPRVVCLQPGDGRRSRPSFLVQCISPNVTESSSKFGSAVLSNFSWKGATAWLEGMTEPRRTAALRDALLAPITSKEYQAQLAIPYKLQCASPFFPTHKSKRARDIEKLAQAENRSAKKQSAESKGTHMSRLFSGSAKKSLSTVNGPKSSAHTKTFRMYEEASGALNESQTKTRGKFRIEYTDARRCIKLVNCSSRVPHETRIPLQNVRAWHYQPGLTTSEGIANVLHLCYSNLDETQVVILEGGDSVHQLADFMQNEDRSLEGLTKLASKQCSDLVDVHKHCSSSNAADIAALDFHGQSSAGEFEPDDSKDADYRDKSRPSKASKAKVKNVKDFKSSKKNTSKASMKTHSQGSIAGPKVTLDSFVQPAQGSTTGAQANQVIDIDLGASTPDECNESPPFSWNKRRLGHEIHRIREEPESQPDAVNDGQISHPHAQFVSDAACEPKKSESSGSQHVKRTDIHSTRRLRRFNDSERHASNSESQTAMFTGPVREHCIDTQGYTSSAHVDTLSPKPVSASRHVQMPKELSFNVFKVAINSKKDFADLKARTDRYQQCRLRATLDGSKCVFSSFRDSQVLASNQSSFDCIIKTIRDGVRQMCILNGKDGSHVATVQGESILCLRLEDRLHFVFPDGQLDRGDEDSLGNHLIVVRCASKKESESIFSKLPGSEQEFLPGSNGASSDLYLVEDSDEEDDCDDNVIGV